MFPCIHTYTHIPLCFCLNDISTSNYGQKPRPLKAGYFYQEKPSYLDDNAVHQILNGTGGPSLYPPFWVIFNPFLRKKKSILQLLEPAREDMWGSGFLKIWIQSLTHLLHFSTSPQTRASSLFQYLLLLTLQFPITSFNRSSIADETHSFPFIEIPFLFHLLTSHLWN